MRSNSDEGAISVEIARKYATGVRGAGGGKPDDADSAIHVFGLSRRAPECPSNVWVESRRVPDCSGSVW